MVHSKRCYIYDIFYLIHYLLLICNQRGVTLINIYISFFSSRIIYCLELYRIVSLIIFITIIIIKKLLAHYISFWLNLCDSNWVIYYCHRITEILHVLYLLLNIFQLKYSGTLKKIHDILSMSPDHLTLTEQKKNCLYCSRTDYYIIF